MSKQSLKAEYDKFTMYQVTGNVRYGMIVLSRRVWWKPWTWRRKKIFVGEEWKKMNYTYAVPKQHINLAPISDFNGDFGDVSVRQVEERRD